MQYLQGLPADVGSIPLLLCATKADLPGILMKRALLWCSGIAPLMCACHMLCLLAYTMVVYHMGYSSIEYVHCMHACISTEVYVLTWLLGFVFEAGLHCKPALNTKQESQVDTYREQICSANP